jgi:Domain of unknown function (DUF397)
MGRVTSTIAPGFRKSSHSTNNGQCVEVATAPGTVLVRDSKDAGGPQLAFGASQWRAFTEGIRRGEFPAQ